MDEELLISLVANYKELYDLQHPYYDDNQRRNNIWEEIGGLMKQPGPECRDKWRKIRDNYRRAKRLRKTKSGQGATHLKMPKYDKILSFLTPYINSETDTESNLPSLDSPVNNITDEDDNFETPTSITTENTPVTEIKKCNYKIHKRSPKSVPDPSTHSLFKSYIEKKYSQKESDRVTAFFTNLGETVKTFPEEIQIRVKREVFKIVSSAEEEVYLRKKAESNNPDLQIINSSEYFNKQQNIPAPSKINTNELIITPFSPSPQTQYNLGPEIEIIHSVPDDVLQSNTLGEYLTFKSTHNQYHK